MFQKLQYEQFVSGTAAGVVTTLILHPLDLIKVRFQVNEGTGVVIRPSYYGMFDAIKRIWQTKGILGLYQGVAPNMIGSGASWGLYFFIYNAMKEYCQDYDLKQELSKVQYMSLSSLSGAMVLCFTNPIWVVKTRLLLQYDKEIELKNVVKYSGIRDCLMKTYEANGIRGLYKGFVPGLFGTCHGAVQFVAYETMKNEYNKRMEKEINAKQAPATSFLLGCTSKCAAAIITYPIQLVRSRAQDQHRSYKRITSIISNLFKYEGIRGFYKGLVPCLLRVTPASGIIFLTYEGLMSVMKPERHL